MRVVCVCVCVVCVFRICGVCVVCVCVCVLCVLCACVRVCVCEPQRRVWCMSTSLKKTSSTTVGLDLLGFRS